jgi:hypothetical protein
MSFFLHVRNNFVCTVHDFLALALIGIYVLSKLKNVFADEISIGTIRMARSHLNNGRVKVGDLRELVRQEFFRILDKLTGTKVLHSTFFWHCF